MMKDAFNQRTLDVLKINAEEIVREAIERFMLEFQGLRSEPSVMENPDEEVEDGELLYSARG